MSSFSGYYRYPAISGDRVVFVSEDDLWTVSGTGGLARRLTANLGPVSYPSISPDGKHIAFSGTEEGNPEVFIMPLSGGPARRLTFTGSVRMMVCGWTKDSKEIIFASSALQPTYRALYLFKISRAGGQPIKLQYGTANHISFGPGKRAVLGRNTGEPARWKRYRGGTAGHFWIDTAGKGNFKRFLDDLNSNLTCPMWIGDRIYFISDHEGIGNLYSVNLKGKNINRHTNHSDYYVRNASTDGNHIIYHSGGDLFTFSLKTGKELKVNIDYNSSRTDLNRKFVSAPKYLQGAELSGNGKHIAINSRGRVFNTGLWNGPVFENGDQRSARYRLPRWLHDNKRLILVSDESGEEQLMIYHNDNSGKRVSLSKWDLGRITDINASPQQDLVLLTNHRYELYLIDLKNKTRKLVDKSNHMRIGGLAWAPDGKWFAYHGSISRTRTAIKICRVSDTKIHRVTEPVYHDSNPEFSEDGKFIYFISTCVFNPVYDHVQFELSFMKSEKICVIPLTSGEESPFEYNPERFKPKDEMAMMLMMKGKKPEKKKVPRVKIDLKGIKDRVISFPIQEERYGRVKSSGTRVFYSVYQPEGALNQQIFSSEAPAKGVIRYWDFVTQKEDEFVSGITDFDISKDRSKLLYIAGNKIRIISTAKKPDPKLEKVPQSHISGWFDFNRIKLEIHPRDEWKQMFSEAWRLQRDQFWTENMSRINWKQIHSRYSKLLDRINTRSEFSDLMWEMQGELGTSHAYEIGGDYRPRPVYRQGYLGAEYKWDSGKRGYAIHNIVTGDPREKDRTSPLLLPGINIEEGDVLLAVDGKPVTKDVYPEKLLVNKAASQVKLTVKKKSGKKLEKTVTALRSEYPARYREWVETNREYVHTKTKGKIGYVHIPDMGPEGFSEFHRYFLPELEKDGLIVDVRFNGGGHVSQLIIEKLARKILGFDVNRWGTPESYPGEAVRGPIVAVTNEHAGSDGDIFSHVFKLMKIGPLVGKRTWGGVIGIWPRHFLVDNTITTQPEFSFWFTDVGWKVENYGTDPDYDVDIKPQDYAKGKDPQLDKAIELIKKDMKRMKIKMPDLKSTPDLSLPKLKKK